MMNIGDRVRLLHHKEEGIITKIIDKHTVEVAIDGDFRIPVLSKEVSVISQVEAMVFGTRTEETKSAIPTTPVYATQGIFLAFEAFNDRELLVHIINNTDFDLLLSFGHESNQIYRGVYGGLLKQRSSFKTPNVMLVKDFDQWPTFVFQLMYHRDGAHKLMPPMHRRMRFKANTFFKTKQTAPILGKPSHLFQIDRDDTQNASPTEAIKVSPETILGKIQEPKGGRTLVIEPPQTEWDLHIEKLVPDTMRRSRMDSAEMLACQIATFEKALDNAIANGVPEVTFIHGVGQGVLRAEIHKRLGKNTHVQFFKDARKDKFGYGATLVAIK